VQAVLVYMYTGEFEWSNSRSTTPLTHEMAFAVMQCADELGIDALVQKYEQCVVEKSIRCVKHDQAFDRERMAKVSTNINRVELLTESPSRTNLTSKRRTLLLLTRTLVWLGKYKHAYRLLDTIDYSRISSTEFARALAQNRAIIECDQFLSAHLSRIARFLIVFF
jgi:hypothetical protein